MLVTPVKYHKLCEQITLIVSQVAFDTHIMTNGY